MLFFVRGSRTLMEIDKDPWKGLPRGQVKPKAKIIRDGVMRRHQLKVTAKKKLDNCVDEIEILKAKIEKHKKAQEEANVTKQVKTGALERSWVGKHLYL
jgi:hypothetical protein